MGGLVSLLISLLFTNSRLRYGKLNANVDGLSLGILTLHDLQCYFQDSGGTVQLRQLQMPNCCAILLGPYILVHASGWLQRVFDRYSYPQPPSQWTETEPRAHVGMTTAAPRPRVPVRLEQICPRCTISAPSFTLRDGHIPGAARPTVRRRRRWRRSLSRSSCAAAAQASKHAMFHARSTKIPNNKASLLFRVVVTRMMAMTAQPAPRVASWHFARIRGIRSLARLPYNPFLCL